MRISSTLISVLAVASSVTGSWLSNSAYNKWHETELERWLTDHEIPYTAAADRKELEDIVGQNWNKYALAPYEEWDVEKLNAYLTLKGVQAKDAAKSSRDSLLGEVKKSWYESEDKAQEAWVSVKDWILDTWTESQLKVFADNHGIPIPHPRKRDTILQKVRENYQALSKEAGSTAAYPGNWLYATWTESDLKEWLDVHGFPALQPTNRDKLIARVRRNSRLAHLQMQDKSASATATARAAYQTLSDSILDAWSESELREFADKNGINTPQGTKTKELRALIRKNRAEIMGDTVASSAASALGAATSKAGNQYAQATDSAYLAAQDAFNTAVDSWSESRLKAYLDARGVPAPSVSRPDEMRALVRKHNHKAVNGWSVWTFDDFSRENLRNYLEATSHDAAEGIAIKADATREDLVSAAQSAYLAASSAGGNRYASATSYLAQQTSTAKALSFDNWSESDIKAYLDSYGVPAPQYSSLEEMKALARRQSTYFRYGTSSPGETLFARVNEGIKDTWEWVKEIMSVAENGAQKKTDEVVAKVENVREEL